MKSTLENKSESFHCFSNVTAHFLFHVFHLVYMHMYIYNVCATIIFVIRDDANSVHLFFGSALSVDVLWGGIMRNNNVKFNTFC